MRMSGRRLSQAEETAHVEAWMLDVYEEISGGQWSRESQCPRSACRRGPEPTGSHIQFPPVTAK